MMWRYKQSHSWQSLGFNYVLPSNTQLPHLFQELATVGTVLGYRR
jgi:hypothetical protein